MTCYVCLDARSGMLFNRRRQSRDAAVLEDIRESVPGVLTADAFSEKLLLEAGIPCSPAPDDLSTLPPESHFFLECRPAQTVIPHIRTLVIYRWNRHYPADLFWDADLTEAGFSLLETREFPGRSHERITKEVYTR